MTPEQLEAHRVRFEQQYADYKLWPVVVVYSRRSVYSDTYDHIELQAAWQAYQWALADTDRAQRAAPGVQGGEVRFGGRCEKHLSPKPCAACAQPPQQSAQPSMQDALAAGDGTLHGAIDYWQAKCAELEAKLAQSAQPAAWACWLDDEDMDKCSPSINKEEPKAYSKRRALVYAAAWQLECILYAVGCLFGRGACWCRAKDLHEERRVRITHLGGHFADATIALNVRSPVRSAIFNYLVCHITLL